jgi:hypothetical protein
MSHAVGPPASANGELCIVDMRSAGDPGVSVRKRRRRRAREHGVGTSGWSHSGGQLSAQRHGGRAVATAWMRGYLKASALSAELPNTGFRCASG